MPISVDSATVDFLSCPDIERRAISADVDAEQAVKQGCVPLHIEQGLVSVFPSLTNGDGRTLHIIICYGVYSTHPSPHDVFGCIYRL